jgi:hypothetical protein
MTDWATAITSTASLVTGSVLTLFGQVWLDNRKRRQEERATDFEFQRAALMEAQEMLADFEQRVSNERFRRTDEYKYFDSRPTSELGQIGTVLAEQYSRLQHKIDKVKASGPATSEDRDWIEREMKELIVTGKQFADATSDFHSSTADFLQARLPFMREYLEFIHKFRVRMYRSGSNLVRNAGEEYIDAVGEWNNRVVTKNIDQFDDRVRSAAYELNRAMAAVMFRRSRSRFDQPG